MTSTGQVFTGSVDLSCELESTSCMDACESYTDAFTYLSGWTSCESYCGIEEGSDTDDLSGNDTTT